AGGSRVATAEGRSGAGALVARVHPHGVPLRRISAAVRLMKAITRDTYGSPDVLELREIDKPPLTPDGILVRVRAASINPYDWHMVRGIPYVVRLMEGLTKPKEKGLGAEAAGVVEAVGDDVTEFHPGDEVFGSRYGSLAEYLCGRERNFVPKPATL